MRYQEDNEANYDLSSVQPEAKQFDTPEEIQLELLEPDYGKDNINKDLQKYLAGNWSELSVFRKGFRLGNLDAAQAKNCVDNIDLAQDLLTEGYTEPFKILWSRVISRIEISHSKKGFMRKMLNTMTQEYKGVDTVKNKSLITGKNKDGD